MIGGFTGGDWTATVELFQVKTRRWPQPLPHPSVTICGDVIHVYIVVDMETTVAIYSCSLQILPSSDHITVSISPPVLDPSPSPTSHRLNSCYSLWTASNHWWESGWATSQLHSPASGRTVDRDRLYDNLYIGAIV